MRTGTPLPIVAAAVILLPVSLSAQGVHVHHAFPNACNGSIFFSEPFTVHDSVVWSNGHVGEVLEADGPGTYGFTLYQDGQAVYQDTREIELNGWAFELNHEPVWSGMQISGHVSVAYCGTQIFNSPCCMPDPAQTTIVVFQDGVPFSVAGQDVQCAISALYVTELPYGHLYTIGVDDPVCGGLHMAAMQIVAHGCANLEVVTEVASATGGEANGSVTLVEAIPDPDEPYAITAPVIGTAGLYNISTSELVELFENVGTATWSDLAAGAYELYFSPDQGCQRYSTVIEVGMGHTSIGEDAGRPGVRLFPAITDGALQLSADGDGAIDLRIIDVHGRELMRASPVSGSIDVSALPPGPYLARMQQGSAWSCARFIKR